LFTADKAASQGLPWQNHCHLPKDGELSGQTGWPGILETPRFPVLALP
jgi:hypothetical protein